MWDREIELGLMTLPLWGFALASSVVCGVLTLLGTRKSLKDCELPLQSWPLLFGLAGSALSALFVVSVLHWNCQQIPVVLPSEAGKHLRVLSHLSLLVLLLLITSTDLRSYYILEWTCWLGIVIGVIGAFASGELHLVHVWIDWNQEQPQLQGPYFPPWLATHQHWHGLAWSLGGVFMGVFLAWTVKQISTIVLAMPTLGAGDIYLMAMIGAFLGWQPTLIAFALAPLYALLIGGMLRTVSNRPALPYGPFLALGALSVLLNWRWIWMLEIPLTLAPEPDRNSIFAVRRFFGDWVALLTTAGLALGLFVLLLSLLRLYKSLELKR